MDSNVKEETGEDELSYLMDLADAIGERIARGDLPPQDKNGFYILP